MSLQHFSHQHPLVFIESHGHEIEKVNCSGCGELVSGSSFGCVECGFYLHKQCAEAPVEMDHPFHRNHNLNLLARNPYDDGICPCDFCGKTCENFVYHCSCNLNFHIKCALFSHSIAEKRNAEFQDIPRIDPSINTGNVTEELKKAQCFACWKPLLDFVYFSPNCGFYLHAKCVDLPEEINHLFHQEHPLFLQFNSQRLSCKICQETQRQGFVYCCSPCKFVLHIQCATVPTKINQPLHREHPVLLQNVNECLPCQICQETTELDDVVYFCSICKFVLHIRCVSSPQTIEDKLHHEHPFTLFPRQVSFCDACGSFGNYVPYICSTCGIFVHKKCISVPRIIKFYRHRHSISHTYFIERLEHETWECRVCLEEVNTKHGSYFCSKCNYIVHVKCTTENSRWYYEVDSTETEEETDSDEPVDLREIHPHNLILSGDITEFKQCDGCLLPIDTCYCYCSQCDFFLHKACAALPAKKHLWFRYCQKLHKLTSGCIFRCDFCSSLTSGFAYTCDKCKDRFCLRCSLVSDMLKCEGHEHRLRFFLSKNKEFCRGCGESTHKVFTCKLCNFNLDWNCIRLPLTAQHSSDVHPFKLTYHEDDDNYSEVHYCDICKGERNPKHWFYHCSACNTSAHPICVLKEYPFIKPPAMVASAEGYPSKDDDSLPSVAAPSPPKEGERSSSSFNQPQPWQTSDRVNPPTRHPSGSTSQSFHSAIPTKAHSNTGYTPLPSVEAPSARVPLKVDPIPMNNNPRPPHPDEERMAYRGETTVPEDEITPATADSIEASPKNDAVKRKISPPPSSSPPCCCIS